MDDEFDNFDDFEDDKTNVRSAIDALGDTLTKDGKKKRGRPRKNPIAPASASRPSTSSTSKRSASKASESSSESDGGSSNDGDRSMSKRRRRGTDDDDDDWNESNDQLTLTQRRTRKRPTLYADEFAKREEERRKRRGGGNGYNGRGRPPHKTYATPTRTFAATYNKQVQPKWSKEEENRLEKLKSYWHDMHHPVQAKLRVLALLRKAQFEKSLELITPLPDKTSAGSGNIISEIKDIFGQLPSSAGFIAFINSIRLEACLAIYEICDKLFVLSNDLSDNFKIAQALRFWWNCLSFGTRRRWEKCARAVAYGKDKDPNAYNRPCAAGYEVPIHADRKRLADEENWEFLHSSNLERLEDQDNDIVCPLCERDEKAEERTVKMGSVRDIQEHFFHNHWQVHGYACHFCGTMFATADDLMANHSECAEWVSWNAARILSPTKTGKLGMSCCRVLMACADCGWYTTLSTKERSMDRQGKMNYLKTFFSYHNNDGLLAMIIYFPAKPSDEVETIRFPVTPTCGGDPQSTCTHCDPPVSLRDPAQANEHIIKEHKDKALACDVCHAKTTTNFLLKQHQLSHVHDNSFLADFLSHSARVFPPPTMLSAAPRCGWKHRATGDNFACGGLIGGVGANKGFHLNDPRADVRDVKARYIAKRRSEGKPTCDGGYENAEIEEESDMARKVREKLMRKYADCEFMEGFEEPIWLKDEDAIKFRDLMNYWESAEGKREGGPLTNIVVDVGPSSVRIPSVEVELQFKDIDIISGYLLNENVFYCTECDTILKGAQAAEHLKLVGGDEEANKCAMDEGEADENPHTNENLFQLYSFAVAPSNTALPCPHCSHKACSITGLRVHVMAAHGKFVKYKRVENETVTTVSLKYDFRTRLAKSIDASLKMLPSGMLPRRLPMVTDVSAISQDTWSQVLFSAENCDPQMMSQMKLLNDRGWTYSPPHQVGRENQVPPRPPPAQFMNFAPRGGYLQQQMGRGRPMIHRPMIQAMPQRQLSFEQHLQQQQMQQRGGIPQLVQGRVGHISSPVGRPPMARGGATPNMSRAHVGGGATLAMARALGTEPRLALPVQQQKSRTVVEYSHREGDKDFFNCKICTNGIVFERELIKAHLTRCHLHMCGHCTACYVYEHEAKMHARKCRGERDQRYYHPDPRLPHVKTRCSFCPVELPLVEMSMHLLDCHLDRLEYDMQHGRLKLHLRLADRVLNEAGKEPEVERLRYKYYVPSVEAARAAGYQMCHVCGLHVPDNGKLQIHLKLHPEFMYFCWVCPRGQSASMGQVNAIARHLRTAHLKDNDWTSGFLPCPNCHKNIVHRPLQHLMYECEHNAVCQLCRDLPMFENANELNEHREKCHYTALRRFECSHCAQYFSQTQDFVKHVCNEEIMKTKCSCGVDFKTRKMFTDHFTLNHWRGDVCRICSLQFKTHDERTRHIATHGKTMRPPQERILLICAYGELTLEARTLYTTVSNSSFRLRGAQAVTGGTQDQPVQLSDDDDDDIEVITPGVQQDRQRAAASAAHALLHPPATTAAGTVDTPKANGVALTVEGEVLEIVKRMVNDVVRSEEGKRSSERRGASEEEARDEEMPVFDLANDSDEDIMMIDDDVPAPSRNLSARVRVEADDSSAIGGQNMPGYEDEEEKEDGTPNVPVIRHFTPAADDDDDLCVVAEVENPGCNVAAATISKQREKKFGCPKCSSKFMTGATLADHIKNAHQFDAGQTTIMEELGMPMGTFVWICKSCCLAFQTEHQKKTHCNQHGQRMYRCDHCSGCAYNNEVINQHHRRVKERKVTYVCGECKLEFDHETSLHEHSNAKHGVTLFYFCKGCEMGSTDGPEIYRHFMMGCNSEPRQRQKTGDEAIACIGVCPARQLHFQPVNVEAYKQSLSNPTFKYVQPSICNHRSLIVACDKQISCNECKCLENVQRHVAFLPAESGRIFESLIRPARCAPPLASLRVVFDQWMRDQRDRNQGRQVIRPGPSANRPGPSTNARLFQRPEFGGTATVSVGSRFPVRAADPQPQPLQPGHHYLSGYDSQEAQRRQNEKLAALQMARGGGAGRPPLLTPATPVHHLHNGAPAILRTHARPAVTHTGSYHITGSSSLLPSHRPPLVTPSSLSTMDSLQSIAALAVGTRDLSQSSSATSSPLAAQCGSCTAPLATARDGFIHSLHTADRGAFVCAHCPIAMSEEVEAIKHVVNHMDPVLRRQLTMDLVCPIPSCRAELGTLMAMKSHLPIHAASLCHSTESCLLTFGTAAAAKEHEEIHKASSRVSDCCILCGTKNNWEMDMVDNRGKNLTISHLMKHALKHMYYCKLCDMKPFEQESQIITHFIMSHTTGEADSRSCNDCGVVLESNLDHKLHCMAKHTITELFVPQKLVVRAPQAMSDFLGVGGQ